MILSDREIRAALDRGVIGINPVPTDERFWASTSVDLRLGRELIRWEMPVADSVNPDPCFRPAAPGYNYAELVIRYGNPVACDNPEGYRLAPGLFILGWTLEKIQLPFRSRLAARVEGKSSLARIGLGVHVTAPTIHAGFGESKKDGLELQLEIWNFGPLPIILQHRMPICQLIFEEVHGTPNRGYGGQFAKQGPASDDSPPESQN